MKVYLCMSHEPWDTLQSDNVNLCHNTKSIGFMRVYDSVKALREEHPDGDYIEGSIPIKEPNEPS